MSKKPMSSYSQFAMEPLTPSDKTEGGMFDSHAPGMIPRDKIDFALKWSIKARGNDNTFDFGKIPLSSMVSTMFSRVKTLNSTEIHVIWKSHVPPTTGTDTVSISLLFTQYEGFENQLQVSHAHPTHLHMHHIFYPRNTCSIVGGGILPWAIDIHVDGEEYKRDYVVADVYIRLKGYGQPISTYPEDRESDLISLVPLDIPIQGIKMSKPRSGGEKWITGKAKRGTSSALNVKKMILLQQMGVDLEGASMMKVLKGLLAAVPAAAVSKSPTAGLLEETCKAVNAILKTEY